MWLQKLAAGHRKDTVYEVRDARDCELCGLVPGNLPPQTDTMGVQQLPELGADLQLAPTVTPASKMLRFRDEDQVPALTSRKRQVEGGHLHDEEHTEAKRHKFSGAHFEPREFEAGEVVDETTQFLESLVKELDVSRRRKDI